MYNNTFFFLQPCFLLLALSCTVALFCRRAKATTKTTLMCCVRVCYTLVVVVVVVGGLVGCCFLSCEIIVCTVQEQSQESAYVKSDQSNYKQASISAST